MMTGMLLNVMQIMSSLAEFHSPAMGWGGWIAIVSIAALCLMCSAFVSGSEIAFFGLSPARLHEMRGAAGSAFRRIVFLTDHSERLLATILISNNLVNITMVILLAFAINNTVEFHSDWLSFVVQSVVLTFLLLLFGEVLPKLTAKGRMEQWALWASGGIMFAYRLFTPLSKLMVKGSGLVGRVVVKKDETVSAEDMTQALEISDVTEKTDKEMLEGILTLGDKQVSDIMISRIDVTAIEYHADRNEVMRTILESGYSRIPVYDTSEDTIRGILYSKDLLPHLDSPDEKFRWQSLIRKAYFVPESRPIDDLLEDFRKRKIHIAVVVDEYGGTSGIVTLEDILEEIVGEIDDEYDAADTPLYRCIGPDSWRFDAKIPLMDFYRITDTQEDDFPHADEAESLGGLLLAIKGDFPQEKESIEAGPCRFIVLKMERHRIATVMVKLRSIGSAPHQDKD